MESREFVCPTCDNPIAIKVLGSDLKGVFTLDCDHCRSHLTIDLSKTEPKLVEPPQPKGARSAYNRLPPELVEREQRMKEAFEEAWGSPPPGAYLHDDMVPPPGRSSEPRRPPASRDGGARDDGTSSGADPSSSGHVGDTRRSGHPDRYEPTPFHRDGRPPIVAPGPRFPFQPFGKGPTGPLPTYLMIATGLLAAAAMMGFFTIYNLVNFADMAAGDGEQDITIILENDKGNLITLDDNNSQLQVIIFVDDQYFNKTPNDQGRYVLEGVLSGEAVITVKWPGFIGQKREVIITENDEMTYMSDRYIGNHFDFQLEKGTGIKDTESNPIMVMLSVCVVMILLFSMIALVGAYFTYTRRSYPVALLGGLGGILAIGWLIGPVLAVVAIYLIYRSKEEFPSSAPPSPWGRLPPLPPDQDHSPPGYHQPPYHRSPHHPPDHRHPEWSEPYDPYHPTEPGDRWGPPLDEGHAEAYEDGPTAEADEHTDGSEELPPNDGAESVDDPRETLDKEEEA